MSDTYFLPSFIVNEFESLVKKGAGSDNPLWQFDGDTKVGAPSINLLMWDSPELVDTNEESVIPPCWQLQYIYHVVKERHLAVFAARDERFVFEILPTSENYEISSSQVTIQRSEEEDCSYEILRTIIFIPKKLTKFTK